MAAANRAYAQGDLNTLRTLLDEWVSSPEGIYGDGQGASFIWMAPFGARIVAGCRRIYGSRSACSTARATLVRRSSRSTIFGDDGRPTQSSIWRQR